MIDNRHLKVFLLCLFLANHLLCQITIKGRVIEKGTKKYLPFVNVVITGTHKGTTTDIDGKFKLKSNLAIESLTLTYIGYKDKTISIKDTKQPLIIEMQAQAYSINTYTVNPGVNPAVRIIKKVIENKKINNPERNTDFQYLAYNKFYVTAHIDSSSMQDSTSVNLIMLKADTSKNDSTESAEDFLKKNYLFLMESVSKRKHHKPDKDHIEVIASRVSGFKNPSFTMLATAFQSFSIYKNFITITGKNYLSPISSKSYKKYLFIIEDTAYQDNDTIFIMSYRPFKGKNFKGLKGQISINTNGFAVQNIIASPSNEKDDGIYAKIIQKYKYVDGKQWFPVQLNTILIFNNIDLENYQVLGVGHTYIKDINVEDKVTRKDIKNIDVEISHKAVTRNQDYWNQYRSDTLSQKDLNTYHLIDSVGKANHFDRKLQIFKTLISGKIPWGPINIDLNRILRFNDYEKTRLGIGIHTGQKVSRFFSIGGYAGYGFHDKAFKYGGDLSITPRTNFDLKFKFSYQQDLIERGGVQFYRNTGLISSEDYRNLFINSMDSLEQFGAQLSFRPLKYLRLYGFYNKQNIITTKGYSFIENTKSQLPPSTHFDLAQYGLAFRYSYGEKFYKSTMGTFSLSSKYPVFWIKFTHAVHGWNGTEYFNKIDIALDANKKWRNIGTSAIEILAGYVDRDLPATFLYNIRGSGINYSLEAPNTFETMRPNRFYSNEYFNVFLMHDFGNLLFKTKHFAPKFRLLTNIGFGKVSHPEQHKGISFETMEQGYYESGIAIDNLLVSGLTGIGISGFYAYGPYSSPYFKDNLFIKFTARSNF